MLSLKDSSIFYKYYKQFTQQDLPACRPILTPGWAISVFIVVGIIFILLGVFSLSASDRVVEIVRDYHQDCVPPPYKKDVVGYIQNADINKTCMIYMTVPKEMKSPVYVYYQLVNFYQNNCRYVRSRNYKQLRSKAYEQSTKGCKPKGNVGIDKAPIVPCGVIAWSLFNDTYQFFVDSKSLGVDKKGIAWESDRKEKFGSDVYPKNFQSHGLIGGAKLNSSLPLSQQEDLMVWMRTAAVPTFRKLYGKIEEDFDANQSILVVVQNNYNTYSFGVKRGWSFLQQAGMEEKMFIMVLHISHLVGCLCPWQ